MITTIELDKKIDNIQDQLDVMNREATSFRSYVNRQFESIAKNMVTKEELHQSLESMEARLRADLASNDDLHNLTEIVIKIAEKVGVVL